MANTQAIKARITSVKNTKQITKAMELVAASKMRRAQQASLASRPYTATSRELLTRLTELIDISKNELMRQAPQIRSKIYVVITSDRGLAGAYNSAVLKQFIEQFKADQDKDTRAKVITIGAKASRMVAKVDEIESIGAYDKFPDRPTPTDVAPIIKTLRDAFTAEEVDQVDVIYTDFKSSIVQEVTHSTLLPASFAPAQSPEDLDMSVFEPSPQAVLDTLIPRLVEAQFFQMVKESQASEHSMRMMAMKNASDNAGEIVDDLTLVYNRARQAKVTQEIAEISAGSEAQK